MTRTVHGEWIYFSRDGTTASGLVGSLIRASTRGDHEHLDTGMLQWFLFYIIFNFFSFVKWARYWLSHDYVFWGLCLYRMSICNDKSANWEISLIAPPVPLFCLIRERGGGSTFWPAGESPFRCVAIANFSIAVITRCCSVQHKSAVSESQSRPVIVIHELLCIFDTAVCSQLQIWDTAGHEKFRTITQSYYRSAHGIIVGKYDTIVVSVLHRFLRCLWRWK